MVRLTTHRSLLSAHHGPGRVLDTEVAASNEISLCLQEAGIRVGEVTINTTLRDVRYENGQLMRRVERAACAFPEDGTITVQSRDLNKYCTGLGWWGGRTGAEQHWGLDSRILTPEMTERDKVSLGD